MSSNVRKCTFWHAPSKDSDQPVHSCILIRIFTGHILDSQGCKVFSCGQQGLVNMLGCAGWFKSSSDAQLCTCISKKVCLFVWCSFLVKILKLIIRRHELIIYWILDVLLCQILSSSQKIWFRLKAPQFLEPLHMSEGTVSHFVAQIFLRWYQWLQNDFIVHPLNLKIKI